MSYTLVRVQTRIVVAAHITSSRDKIARTWWERCKVGNTMNCGFPCADGIVTVSNGAGCDPARFAKLDRKAVRVTHNQIVGEAKRPASEPLDPAGWWWIGSHRKVLAVGALRLVRDYCTLLYAFSPLLILGDCHCRAALGAR